MLSRMLKTGAIFVTGAFLFASIALGASKTIKITQDVVLPGGQTLKAGEYSVVVNEKLDKVEFIQNSKVVASSSCKCTIGKKKNPDTQIQLQQSSGNVQELQQIQLKGETRTINLTS